MYLGYLGYLGWFPFGLGHEYSQPCGFCQLNLIVFIAVSNP
jgi:hypothetical protein